MKIKLKYCIMFSITLVNYLSRVYSKFIKMED
nr:MAG TPA: hypothetical protein [Caudoviricetes sp.]